MSDTGDQAQAADSSQSDHLGVGTIVAGRYAVERRLGSGGMGEVVTARHVRLGNQVAIKFLRSELAAQRDSVERFLREAKAAVALQNEHVARVMDVGTLEDGLPYMVMELLRGADLEMLLADRGPLPVAEAVHYVLQACVALAEAHNLGLVHRDLKSSNLFLTHGVDGAPLVKVLDFGIAKGLSESADGDLSLTATGTALGTPLFMSPEQVRDAKSVDRRSDIWALGCVLHELLTGAPPFEADMLPALCAKITADPPTRLRSLRPDAPVALERVVERCLEKDLEQRYQSVASLALALGPFAPKHSDVLVERIERIGEGRVSLPIIAGSRDGDVSHAETLISSPDLDVVDTVDSFPALELADTPPASARTSDPGAPLDDTGSTTQAAPPQQRGPVLTAAAAMVGLVSVTLLWSAPRAGADGEAASTAVPPGSAAPSIGASDERLAPAPQSTELPSHETAEALPTQQAATASASSSAQPRPSSVARPQGPPGGGPTSPTPASAPLAPSDDEWSYELLDERK